MEHARSPLRVVPDADSAQARADASASAWSRADQSDWCVDATCLHAIPGGCSGNGSLVAAMPAAERRAIHLTRQRIRAQAILAEAELGQEHARRERTRRWAIVIASAALHLVGFGVLANAVADLRPRPRPATHEHLFEARAVVPIEPAPIVPTPSEPELVEPQPAKPSPASKPTRKPKPTPAHEHSEPSKATSEPAPFELRGVEFSSEGDAPAGEPGGEAWGQPGGEGSGSGDGSGDEGSSGPSAPDVSATPRGKLLQPEYPVALEREGVEGSVLVKVWIDEHGHVIKAEVVESSGEEAFDHNALMTAQRQEWNAATEDGEAVASTRRYRVHFRLR